MSSFKNFFSKYDYKTSSENKKEENHDASVNQTEENQKSSERFFQNVYKKKVDDDEEHNYDVTNDFEHSEGNNNFGRFQKLNSTFVLNNYQKLFAKVPLKKTIF